MTGLGETDSTAATQPQPNQPTYPNTQEGATGQPLPQQPDEPLPRVAHLYWHPPSSQWVLHLDLDPALNYDRYLGYCKVRGLRMWVWVR